MTRKELQNLVSERIVNLRTYGMGEHHSFEEIQNMAIQHVREKLEQELENCDSSLLLRKTARLVLFNSIYR